MSTSRFTGLPGASRRRVVAARVCAMLFPSKPLPATALLIRRDDRLVLLPPDDFLLAPGDELLIASSLAARRNLELTLHNPNELDYVLTGRELTGSWLAHWLAARRKTNGHLS